MGEGDWRGPTWPFGTHHVDGGGEYWHTWVSMCFCRPHPPHVGGGLVNDDFFNTYRQRLGRSAKRTDATKSIMSNYNVPHLMSAKHNKLRTHRNYLHVSQVDTLIMEFASGQNLTPPSSFSCWYGVVVLWMKLFPHHVAVSPTKTLTRLQCTFTKETLSGNVALWNYGGGGGE
jgi:hypothetical protein